MHEMSLVHSILEIISEHQAQHGFKTVNSLTLSFGRLSCIDKSSLKFAFEQQALGHVAEGAELIFDIKPVVTHCTACSQEHISDSYSGYCPQCKSPQVIMTAGNEELKLLELDVD